MKIAPRGLQTEGFHAHRTAMKYVSRHGIPWRCAIWSIFRVAYAQDIHGHYWDSTIAITYPVQDLVRIHLYNR